MGAKKIYLKDNTGAVFAPVTAWSAVKSESGKTLDETVGVFNVDAHYPLSDGMFYTHDTAVEKIPASVQHQGLIITYKTDKTTIVNEQCVSTAWSKAANDWKKVDAELPLGKDIYYDEYYKDGYLSQKGAIVPDSDWINTDYISVKGIEYVYWNSGYITANANIVLFDEDKNAVYYYQSINIPRRITVPSGIVYVRASFYKPKIEECYLKANGGKILKKGLFRSKIKDEITKLLSKVDTLSDDYDYKVEKTGMIGKDDATLVDGFELKDGHTYYCFMKTETQPELGQLSFGIGNAGFVKIPEETDLVNKGFIRVISYKGKDVKSRVYFNGVSGDIANTVVTVTVKDLTDPTTMPKVVARKGELTQLREKMETSSGSQGASQSVPLCKIIVKEGQFVKGSQAPHLGICATTDWSVIPYKNVRVSVHLPDSLQCQFCFGTNSTVNESTDWLSNGDEIDMVGKKYFAINFSDKGEANTLSVGLDGLKELIRSGAVSMTINRTSGYNLLSVLQDSDKYVRRTIGKDDFVFIHTSDIHGDVARYMHALEYADSIGADMFLNTGDSVSYINQQGCSYVPVLGEEHVTPSIVVAGNHDMAKRANTATVIAELLGNLPSKFGYKMSESTTGIYYFRDFLEKKVRIIVLDVCDGNTGHINSRRISQEQAEWFVNTLNSTPVGYGVIVAKHEVDNTSCTSLDENFRNRLDKRTLGESTEFNLRGVVDKFISRSSGSVQVTTDVAVNVNFTSVDSSIEFLAWLIGHGHNDFVGKYGDTENTQLVLAVDCTSAVQSGTDLYRDIDGTMQDSFNVIAVNRTSHHIKVMKVGSNVRKDNTDCKIASVSYL